MSTMAIGRVPDLGRESDDGAGVVRGRSRPSATGPAPLRLTRRARRLLVLALAVTVVVIGLSVAARSQAAAPADSHLPTVVVQQGDTLYAIARRSDPGADPWQRVAAIRKLNHLPGYTVEAGRQLRLPASR